MLLLLSLTFVLVKAQSAQIQVPNCLPAALAVWNWTYNSLEQSPCSTAGYLAAQCGNGEFTIPQLAIGNHYTGPSGNTSKDLCQCNSVLYSVLSACTGCQKGTWLSYDDWTANCSSKAPMSTFPQSISSSTRVPAWAFLNVTTSAPWNNVSACAFGGSPESVGTIRPSFAPQFSAAAALKAGVIAGVVTGATVIGFIAIASGVWYLVRRRRRQRRTPKGNNDKPPSIGGTTKDNAGYESVPWTPRSDMKFYDPKDPSTYPDLAAIPENTSNVPASATVTSLDSSKELKAGAKPQRTHYLGLPEV